MAIFHCPSCSNARDERFNAIRAYLTAAYGRASDCTRPGGREWNFKFYFPTTATHGSFFGSFAAQPSGHIITGSHIRNCPHCGSVQIFETWLLYGAIAHVPRTWFHPTASSSSFLGLTFPSMSTPLIAPHSSSTNTTSTSVTTTTSEPLWHNDPFFRSSFGFPGMSSSFLDMTPPTRQVTTTTITETRPTSIDMMAQMTTDDLMRFMFMEREWR